MRMISHIDRRHTCSTEDMGERQVLKCYLYHVGLYGPNSCLLEEDDMELDPIEYVTDEAYEAAVAKFNKKKAKKDGLAANNR